MSEEVNIRINETRQGNAVADEARRIEDLKTKIAELNRLEQAYSGKGMSTAASSVRSERAPLERELAQHTKARAAEERAITNEHRQQEAVAKARETRTSRVGNAILGGVTSATGGGHGIAGMVPNALMNSPVGIAAVVATVIGAVVGGAAFSQQRQLRLIGMRDEAAGKVQARGFERQSTFEGTAGGLRGQGEDYRDEVVKRRADRERLEEEAKFRLFTPKTWLPAITGANRNPIIENEQAIARAMEGEAKAKEMSREKFKAEGGLEIEQQRARAEGRYKEAIAIDQASQALKRYKELRAGGATEAEAKEGAALTLRQKEIDVQRGLGSLAGARDGRGNLAALASLGSGFSNGEATGRLDQLIKIVDASAKNNAAAGPLQTHRR